MTRGRLSCNSIAIDRKLYLIYNIVVNICLGYGLDILYNDF